MLESFGPKSIYLLEFGPSINIFTRPNYSHSNKQSLDFCLKSLPVELFVSDNYFCLFSVYKLKYGVFTSKQKYYV